MNTVEHARLEASFPSSIGHTADVKMPFASIITRIHSIITRIQISPDRSPEKQSLNP
jgi:hypothetical protein